MTPASPDDDGGGPFARERPGNRARGRAPGAGEAHGTVAAPDPPGSAVAAARAPVAKIVAAVLAVVLGAFVVVLATRPAADSRFIESNVLGRPAPNADVDLETLDGEPIRLADFRGRNVLLNFFASWCVPCQREQAVLKELHERLGPTGQLVVVGVVFADEPGRALQFQIDGGATWPSVVDDRGQFALDFGVRQPPENYLVDANGVVRAQFYELQRGQLDAVLRGL